MQIQPITTALPLGGIERARDSMNAAYNAIAAEREAGTLPRHVQLAKGYLGEARAEMLRYEGHEATDDARTAARAVLPRIDHALLLLATLEVAADPLHVTPLLDEIGIAMDHVETVLAGVGWE